MDIVNDFSKLDTQSAESHFAQFTTEEHAEYQAWLDQFCTARDTAGEPLPMGVDGSGATDDF